jgi:AraC family transcriptional regulator
LAPLSFFKERGRGGGLIVNRYYMHARIEMLSETKLIGKRLTMTFADNKTVDLWKSFMPRRKEIKNNLNTDLISMQVYVDLKSINDFNLTTPFQKWAAVEVESFDNVPNEMETFTLPAGLYAVFIHKGLNTDTSTFEYIFGTWLSTADYELDNRPHFEVLGEKYKNNAPDSEEEIWIPVKLKWRS